MGMYDNNPEARNTCKECGRECPPWEEVCLACEMKYDEEKEQKEKNN
jgi:hypothetical protein